MISHTQKHHSVTVIHDNLKQIHLSQITEVLKTKWILKI